MKNRKKGCAFTLLVVLIFVVIVCLALTVYRDRITQFFFPLDYQEYVEASAAEFGLDPWLIFAVIREESSFRAEAQSSAGALGLMQLMPTTAEWAVTHGGFAIDHDTILEPEHNIRLGCWYIDWLRNYYEGDLYAALAAYNAGITNVNQWLEEGVWDGSLENVGDIPFAETRRYVGYVWESYEMYCYLYGS